MITLTGEGLTLAEFVQVASKQAKVELSASALNQVERARNCIEERLKSGQTYYGINTGFGSLAHVRIDSEKLDELQLNLIRSHACGVGDALDIDVVRGVMLLRIQTMLRGNSGVRVQTVKLMQEFLNRGITPVVPSQGSVGACGDLAPLAHLALALIGEGEVFYQGKKIAASEALRLNQLTPLSPKAKEGLCLINGTQVMTSLGLLSMQRAQTLLKVADLAVAISLEALKGTSTAFRAEIQKVRGFQGQGVVAENVRALLQSSEINQSHAACTKVQDPYSLRCAPQVHGASRNAWAHAHEILVTEANASTDNPLVFAESDEILSGGNFHGEPVAMVLDYMAIAVSELASISERRIEKLVNPHMSGLPAFLSTNSGLNSGYMIPHVVAASLVSENKIYAHPASVDSIPTSAEQEDHVSMGMTSSLKLHRIIKNTARVLAIELLAACEGVEFHRPLKSSAKIESVIAAIRKKSPAMKDKDRSIAQDIEWVAEVVLSGELVEKLGLK